MDKEQAINAVRWASDHLDFNKPLTQSQFDDWIEVAQGYTKEEWANAIRGYYKDAKNNFPPPLGKIKEYLPTKEVEQKKAVIGWPEGWVEDPNKSPSENQRSFSEAMAKQRQGKK